MFARPFILPASLIALIALAMILGGPIFQPLGYHAFADQRELAGIPNAADVLSNLGFLAVGIYGLALMPQARPQRYMDDVRFSYGLFFVALVLTAAGSSWYHLAPDNIRLLSDRLPIALACAALLAVVARRYLDAPRCINGLLVAFAVGSVAWWGLSGDLRPYLLLQMAPMLAIPAVLVANRAPKAELTAFLAAIALYALAKVCELADARLFMQLPVSGHTLKHMVAALGALCIAWNFGREVKAGDSTAALAQRDSP
ncbi:MAG TPA: hypothetical protein VFT37_10180 [Telluria sp.]|nr:hypothetical protein [Telluria sp.]